MKQTCLVLLSVAILSSQSLADTTCKTVTAGHHLLAGHIDRGALQVRATMFMALGSIEPRYVPVYPPPGFPPPGYQVPIPRGYGCVLTVATNATLCFSNNVTPVLPLNLPAGYSLVCCQTNGPATFEAIVGRPPNPGTRLYRYLELPDNTPQYLNETNYLIFTFTDGTWLPEVPVADMGEAVWVFEPPTMSNVQIAAGQFGFDALTPSEATATVEYTGALEDTNSWTVLTNLAGIGGVANVVDPTDINVVPQRFYRLNLHK